MTDERPQQEEPIDVRVLAREKLTHEAFPGGRNEGLRVFFTPRGARGALAARRRSTRRSRSAEFWWEPGIATKPARL